ncbi:MAG: PKD domain-containing protein [Coriobacteriia bacterium]|nr:PKD domain-containing protein [Coriobacteriia bacterium]
MHLRTRIFAIFGIAAVLVLAIVQFGAALDPPSSHDPTALPQQCFDCHLGHNAPGYSLTRMSQLSNLCLSCHATSPANFGQWSSEGKPLDFGPVPVGDSKEMTRTVSNAGSTPLEVTDIFTNSPAFTAQPGTPLPVTLPPGDPSASIPVTITFSPESAGEYECRIYMVGSDPFDPIIPDDMTGTGEGVEGPPADNLPPSAIVNGPVLAEEGASIQFEADALDPNGDMIRFAWDLDGDGRFNDSSEASPTHSFGDDGVKPVSLRVHDVWGAFSAPDAVSLVTVVNAPPVVDPEGLGIRLPTEPRFTELDIPITAWTTFQDPGADDTHTAMWDWGDGHASAAQIIEDHGAGIVAGHHDYEVPGVYEVQVTVTDDDLGSTTLGGVMYDFEPPVVSESNVVPDPAPLGSTILLTVTASDAGAALGDSNIEDIEYSLNGVDWYSMSPTDGVFDSPVEAAEATVDTSGVYSSGDQYVYARARDVRGNVSDAEAIPFHINDPPVADAGGPYEMLQGGPLTLDGTGSHDPEAPADSIVAWEWELDGDGLFDDADGPTPDATAIDYFHIDSFFDISLRVTDSFGASDTATASVTVVNVAPIVTYFEPGSEPFEDHVASVSGTFTDPGVHDIHVATVDWGDGTTTPATVTEPTGETPGSVEATHTYADAGSYPVILSLSDNKGGTTADTAYCSVLPYLEVVAPSDPISANEGSTLDVVAWLPLVDPDDLAVAHIDWGDGTPLADMHFTGPDGTSDASAEATHTYADDGTYTATITVTDDDGAAGTDTFVVTVTNVAPTITSAYLDPGTEPFEGQVVTFRATFTDPGTQDTHSATIHWGDGTVTTNPVIVEPNSPEGSIEATHTFVQNELYVMEVEFKDDDMAGLVMYWDTPVDVQNAPPVLTPPPPIDTEKGKPTPVKATFTDAGTQDSHTATVDWGDGSPAEPAKVTEPNSPDGSVEATHTYDAAGTYTVTLMVADDELEGDTCEVTVTVLDMNDPPVADPNGPYETTETPTPIQLDGTGSYDPGNEPFDYFWDLDDDGYFDDAFGPTPDYLPLDDVGPIPIRLRVVDDSGLSDEAGTTLQVYNAAPVIVPGSWNAPLDPTPTNAPVDARADFTDAGILDVHTASWDWGDGTTSTGIVSEGGGTGTAFGTHTYELPGVYTLTLTVIDDDGGVAIATYDYVVIYDAAVGYVTGHGWITSPAGAFAPDPTLTGKATFGFVSRYKKGASVPTGHTRFRFRVADLDFVSDTYQWLVIAGYRAMYKGTGDLNGLPGYHFMLTGIDNERNPLREDGFRIKIWDSASGEIVYDNQMGEPDDMESATDIDNGNIVIHSSDDPPAAPQNVTVVPDELEWHFLVEWDPCVESDIAGYWIYREDDLGEEFKIGETSISDPQPTQILDGMLTNGRTYRYKVYAVDQRENVSQAAVTVSPTANADLWAH